MAQSETRAVLISVHPVWADALMAGRKRVEFRKTAVGADVRMAIIYATAPMQLVVGWIEIDQVVMASPTTLWRKFGKHGCIDKASFSRYYAGSSVGAAILVKQAHPLGVPQPLEFVGGLTRPPQSFQYVPAKAAERLMAGLVRPRLSA